MSLEIDSGTLGPHGDVLRLEGEIDLARRQFIIDEIELRLLRDSRLVIDVSAVTFIDCAGLSALLWARTRAAHVGGELALVGPCAALSRMLRLTSLDGALPVQAAVADRRLDR